MRPLAVLALVLAASAALFFAYSQISGSERGDGRIVGPATPEVSADEPRADADLTGPERVRRAETPPIREQLAEAGSGALANRVYGRILSPEGLPVAEAKVSMVEGALNNPLNTMVMMMNQGQPEKPLAVTTSDAEGNYEFTGLPAVESVIVADHEDFMRTKVGPVRIPEEGALREDVSMRVGYQLFGYVSDKNSGVKIAGATLYLDNPLSAQLPPGRVSPDRMTAVSGPDGRYEFKHVSPGGKWLTCMAEGYGTVVDNKMAFQDQDELRHQSRDIQMPPELTITGRVVAPDRSPVQGATLDAISYNHESLSRGQATSDGNGQFTIRGLSDADFSITTRAEGYGLSRTNRVAAGSQNIEIELLELGGVMGRAVDAETGKPLSDFRVDVRVISANSTHIGKSMAFADVRNSTTGEFHAKGLNPGNYVAQISAEGYAESRSEQFRVLQGMTVPDITVQVTRGGKITGRVVNAYTGDPVAGVVIQTKDNAWIDSPFTKLFEGLAARSTSKALARTNAEGYYEFELLTPETYQILLEHPDFTTESIKEVFVHEGQVTDLGTTKLFTGAKLTGRAYLSDGSPARGAEVALNASDGNAMRNYSVRTNAEGAYSISNISPGTYRLTLSRPDRNQTNPFQVIVDMKNSEVELSLVDGGEYAQDLYLGAD